MKTIKECDTIEEAIVLLENIISKFKNHKSELKLNDNILISNLFHDLDTLLYYKKSDSRKNKIFNNKLNSN